MQSINSVSRSRSHEESTLLAGSEAGDVMRAQLRLQVSRRIFLWEQHVKRNGRIFIIFESKKVFNFFCKKKLCLQVLAVAGTRAGSRRNWSRNQNRTDSFGSTTTEAQVCSEQLILRLYRTAIFETTTKNVALLTSSCDCGIAIAIAEVFLQIAELWLQKTNKVSRAHLKTELFVSIKQSTLQIILDKKKL